MKKKKNKARVVFLACDTPTRPDICPIKIISNYFRQFDIYNLYKISVQGEISSLQKVRVVFLAHDTPTDPYLCLKIFQTMKKLLSAQELVLEIYSKEITRKKSKARVVLLACDTST